jgi:hypothetical protein
MTFEFTPKQTEAMEALQSEKYNFIMYGGAIRGGKSFLGLGALLVLCTIFPRSRWAVIRENSERIRLTTIPSFKKFEAPGRLKENPFQYTHINGSVILFVGENYSRDKDLDWMKGLEVNGFLFEEINECQQQTLFKAFERAGAWIIPHSKIQPKPIILATTNPSFGWVKELVYDKWKNNTLSEKWLYIPAKITDNPHLPQEYIDSLKNLPRFEYEVFVEGNWDIQLKTGGEFLKGFELQKHVKHINIDPTSLIHVSIDSNVEPYISVTFWQTLKEDNIWKINQIHELPCKDPNNTARKAGELTAKWLREIGYNQKICLYGDRSTKSRNNIDDDKRSFADIFTNSLQKAGYKVENKMLGFAPPVSNIADFINSIFDGTLKFAEITINETCKTSINDYIETKQDKDGSILKKRITNPKTGVSYEPNAHLVDTCKDFITSMFYAEFLKYQNRFNSPKPNMVKQISRIPQITY